MQLGSFGSKEKLRIAEFLASLTFLFFFLKNVSVSHLSDELYVSSNDSSRY